MPAAPKLGALGATFTVMRALQLIALIAIIGLSANFVSEMVAAKTNPYAVLIGTLVVACIAAIYVVLTYILYYDSLLPLLVATGCDTALLIAVIVVACTVGKPLSYLSCEALGAVGNAGSFLGSVGANVGFKDAPAYFSWVGADQRTCYEIKAVWGLSIALCVLFAFSAVTSVCLWRRLKTVGAPPKDLEG